MVQTEPNDSPPSSAPISNAAPAVKPASQIAPFETLLKQFNDCSCDSVAFNTATQMYAYYPKEAKALLPMIKDEQLGYDGKNDATATTSEWAAALVAAKNLKTAKNISFEVVEESAVSHEAQHIYEATKQPVLSCKNFTKVNQR